MEKNDQHEPDVWTILKDDLRTELEQYRRELKEIALMLDQSQLEVNKLAKRNASITSHLQQIQSQFDTMPRADIRMAYDSALDAQQRLFVMRGQAEKLQSDKSHIERYMNLVERVLQTIDSGVILNGSSGLGSSTAEMIEMIIQAQEAERQRLSRQMHDGPAQALSNFILQTEIAMRLFDLDQDQAKDELENLKVSATDTFRKVRDFIFELRPMMLDDLGLVPTLKRYIDATKEQSGLDIRITVSGNERRLQSYQEVMIFRAIQELLNNAIRHSQASMIKIQLDMGDEVSNIKATVDDDGKGFDVDNMAKQGGMGLKVIIDRVEMLGGEVEIDSVVGQGTRVTFHMPAIEVKEGEGVIS
jgi:two-component system sensor histidine kinase DegS